MIENSQPHGEDYEDFLVLIGDSVQMLGDVSTDPLDKNEQTELAAAFDELVLTGELTRAEADVLILDMEL